MSLTQKRMLLVFMITAIVGSGLMSLIQPTTAGGGSPIPVISSDADDPDIDGQFTLTLSRVGEIKNEIYQIKDGGSPVLIATIDTNTYSVSLSESGVYIYYYICYDLYITAPSNNISINVELSVPDEFEISAYDEDCGVGSEQFGVSIDYTFSEDTYVSLVLEEMDDIDGDLILNEDYSTTTEVLVGAGSGSLDLTADILFAEIGTKGSTTTGSHYQWKITAEGFDDIVVDNIGLWHWSTWNSIKNKGDYWECKLRYDDILTDVSDSYTIYAKMMKWDGIDLIEIEDSMGQMVEASALIIDPDNGQEIIVNIDKPDMKEESAITHNGEAWMNLYNEGYYFFSFIAPTTPTTNAWAERIGCPPEVL